MGRVGLFERQSGLVRIFGTLDVLLCTYRVLFVLNKRSFWLSLSAFRLNDALRCRRILFLSSSSQSLITASQFQVFLVSPGYCQGLSSSTYLPCRSTVARVRDRENGLVRSTYDSTLLLPLATCRLSDFLFWLEVSSLVCLVTS